MPVIWSWLGKTDKAPARMINGRGGALAAFLLGASEVDLSFKVYYYRLAIP